MTNGRVKGDLFVGNNVYANGEELATSTALTDGLASKLPYSYGTATPSTSDSGFLWYDSNSTPAIPKFWDGSGFQAIGGKITQIVRATDGSARTTTSTSLVDVTGVSVTITPQKSDSAVLLLISCHLAVARANTTGGDYRATLAITDSSNNTITGAQRYDAGVTSSPTAGVGAQISFPVFIAAWATPATTSAVTYKMRFNVEAANMTATVQGAVNTTQIFAIEVAA